MQNSATKVKNVIFFLAITEKLKYGHSQEVPTGRLADRKRCGCGRHRGCESGVKICRREKISVECVVHLSGNY